jgi:hypothetical protein
LPSSPPRLPPVPSCHVPPLLFSQEAGTSRTGRSRNKATTVAPAGPLARRGARASAAGQRPPPPPGLSITHLAHIHGRT